MKTLSLILAIGAVVEFLAVLFVSQRHGYQRGWKEGRGEGYEKGYTDGHHDADKWWVESDGDAQKVWSAKSE